MNGGRLISVVIPCYRSERYLARTVSELCSVLEPVTRFEIVLVNDGSPDNVQSVIAQLSGSDSRVRYLELGINQGQHCATLKGFGITRGDVVVTVDDDGQNPPEAVLAVVETLDREDADVAYGRFASTRQTAFRRFASRVNLWMLSQTAGRKLKFGVTNVRAIRGDLARRVAEHAPAFPYIDALLLRATRRVVDCVVSHRLRADGESTYSFGKLLGLWINHISTLSILPLRVSTWVSFLIAVFGFVAGIVAMIRVFAEHRAPPGWLSLYCSVTFLFSVLFMCLGILATYVGRLYVSVNARGTEWVRSSSDSRSILSRDHEYEPRARGTLP